MTIRSFGALLAFLLTTAAITPAMAQEAQPTPELDGGAEHAAGRAAA